MVINMSIVIIATHDQMANGIKATAEFLMGPQDNIFAIPAYSEGFEDFEDKVQKIVFKYLRDKIYILTDIKGGSVNIKLRQLIIEKKLNNVYLISGVNLPLVIQLVLQGDTKDLKMIIEDSRADISLIDDKDAQNEESFEDF